MKELNIAIVGTQFMGRAHSNAWFDVANFYKLPFKPVMKVACDNVEANLAPFMKQFGWQEGETSFEKLIARDDIHVIDICTSNATHEPFAVMAAKAGKHVVCEKPLAMNAEQAKNMADMASSAGVKNMTAFNYRRVPALALAKKLIEDGEIGEIRHFNAVYYQDWLVDPDFPMVWRHDAKVAGSGAHGDMNAHTVDLARFLVGDITSVCADEKIFIKERQIAGSDKKGTVTADDACTFLARFENGAQGVFIGTRFATGKKNFLRIEVFGSEGSFVFNLERLNELDFYSRKDSESVQGYRNIVVTESTHPYLNLWWPPGHIIGWEHTFIHEMGDFLTAIAENKDIQPSFFDGYKCQLVLDAATKSARENKWITV